MISNALNLEIWSDGSNGAKNTKKKTYMQRENNKEFLTAQTDNKNIKINFVRLMLCWILQRCLYLYVIVPDGVCFSALGKNNC